MFDETQVRRAIALMYSEPGAIIEVRALKLEDGGALSQYFDASQIDKLVKSVRDMTQMGAGGVYTVLNEINRFTVKQNIRGTWCRTSSGETADIDIASRRLLLIDIDPKRPADTSSNEGEIENALHVAKDIRASLSDLTWPEPVLACSGNGIHLIYRLPDLPNSIESTRIVQGVLIRLSSEYDSETLNIDRAVFNAARISKLYGTVARKGFATAERPHRVGHIIQAPDVLTPVSKDLLLEFASNHMPADIRPNVVNINTGKRVKSFTAEEFMSKYGIHYTKKLPYNDNGYKYWVPCPWMADHSYTNAEDTCLFQTADGALGFHCSHAHCSSRGWNNFRDFYEPRVTADNAQVARKIEGNEEPDLLLDGEDSFTDEGNALRVIRFARGGARYCENQNAWYTWDGARFEKGRGLAATKIICDMFERFTKQAKAAGVWEQFRKHAMYNGSGKALAACLSHMRPRVALRSKELDYDRDQLNFLNGTVDLKTGVLHPHNKANLITKLVDCNYMPDAPCPTWEASLNKILPRAHEQLQVALGYSLTGWTSEKKVFICWGEAGNNGKSTVLATIAEIFEEYSKKLQVDSLLKGKGGLDSNANDDIADLQGKRFANTSELEEGRQINEAMIKKLSQGMGTVSATRKYESSTTFLETYCLWIDTNPFPKISTNDDATWKRFYAFNFDVHLEDHEIDNQMPAKLIAEREGIAAWIVRGAMRWYANGRSLLPNVEGVEAVAVQREAVDTIAPFIDEVCVVTSDDGDWVERASLYSLYEDWAKANSTGARKSTRDQLMVRLGKLGCKVKRLLRGGKKLSVYTGLKIKA